MPFRSRKRGGGVLMQNIKEKWGEALHKSGLKGLTTDR